MLESRFCIEKQSIDHRRILMSIIFAVVTVSGAMFKLAIELERLPSSNTAIKVTKHINNVKLNTNNTSNNPGHRATLPKTKNRAKSPSQNTKPLAPKKTKELGKILSTP